MQFAEQFSSNSGILSFGFKSNFLRLFLSESSIDSLYPKVGKMLKLLIKVPFLTMLVLPV